MKQRLFEGYKEEPFYVVKDDINIEGSCLQEYVTLSPKSVVFPGVLIVMNSTVL